MIRTVFAFLFFFAIFALLFSSVPRWTAKGALAMSKVLFYSAISAVAAIAVLSIIIVFF